VALFTLATPWLRPCKTEIVEVRDSQPIQKTVPRQAAVISLTFISRRRLNGRRVDQAPHQRKQADVFRDVTH